MRYLLAYNLNVSRSNSVRLECTLSAFDHLAVVSLWSNKVMNTSIYCGGALGRMGYIYHNIIKLDNMYFNNLSH